MSRWFKYSLLLTFLLVMSPLTFTQTDEDREAAQALRSAADSMAQLGEIGEGPDASCAKEFSGYFRCQASKLETGSKNACAKPTCSFGNEQLAELLRAVEEEDKRAAAEIAPASAPAKPDNEPDGSDSNAILNAGNEQAAAIRAVGDANAAKQEQAVEARLAAQRAAQTQRRMASMQSQGTRTTAASSSGALPSANTPGPITVAFSHTMSWSQGNAHVVSTPPGIDCPTTCSASFQQGMNVVLQATADSNSIVRNTECYTMTGGGTAPRTPGNSMTCVWPGLEVAKGGAAIIYVDGAGSNQQNMITGNGLPPSSSASNSGSNTNGSRGSGSGTGTSSGGSGGSGGGSSSGQGSSSGSNGASPNAGRCTDATKYVTGTVKVASDGFVVGHLTNNSNQTLYVSYTFARGGKPYGPETGATTIRPGQTIGGEGAGIWASGVDTNPPQIYFYAVLQSDADQGKNCGSAW